MDAARGFDTTELAPVRVRKIDFDEIEIRILHQFRQQLYLPLMEMANASPERLVNARVDHEALRRALSDGRMRYEQGRFTGKLSAAISRDLRAIGAVWNEQHSAFELPRTELPPLVSAAISTGNALFTERVSLIDKWLAKFFPEKIAEKVKSKAPFERVLVRVDDDIQRTLKRVDTITPKLTAEQRERFGAEWQRNLDIWITDFTEKEILKLRKTVADSVFKGQRHEALVKGIQKSYGVTVNKAKFLARQETSLAIAKFQELRYTAAGVNEYTWRCVAGSPMHPVRPSHKILEGKTFRWDDPPITTEAGEPVRRNNPGQDYNCRCSARPVVRFDKKGK